MTVIHNQDADCNNVCVKHALVYMCDVWRKEHNWMFCIYVKHIKQIHICFSPEWNDWVSVLDLAVTQTITYDVLFSLGLKLQRHANSVETK